MREVQGEERAMPDGRDARPARHAGAARAPASWKRLALVTAVGLLPFSSFSMESPVAKTISTVPAPLIQSPIAAAVAHQKIAAATPDSVPPGGTPARSKAPPTPPLPPDRPASVPSVNTPPPAPPVENSYLDGPLLYQLMLAEFNRSEGQAADAIELVLEAARHNRDDALFRRALEISVESGASDKAIAITRAWRQSMPRSTEALRTQVQLYFALDRMTDAGEPLRELLAISPPSERSALIASLPRAAQRAQDKPLAIEQFRTVLEPYLDQPDTRTAARVALARMKLGEGRTGEALQLIRQALAQDPKALGPVFVALDVMNGTSTAAPDSGAASSPPPAPAPQQAMADQKAAEDLVVQYLSDPQAEPLIRQAYAGILVSQQRLTDAANQLTLAIKAKPKGAQLWLGLGEVELELRHPDEATTALEHALALVGDQPAPTSEAAQESAPDATDAAGPTDEADPMNGPVRASQIQLLLARAAEMKHDDATAARWLSRVDTKDTDLQVIALRASILARGGKLAEARALVRNAPAKTPAELRYRLLSEVQLLLDNKKYDDARTLLAKANTEAPDDVDLIYQQAMVDEKLDKLDEMERLLRHVLQLQPSNSQALNALGYSLADRNLRLEEALGFVQQAHALAPSDPFIVDSLGWVLYRLGRYDEATGFLNQAYASRKDTEIAAHLGEALWADGKRDEAAEILRDAHRRDASNDVLKQTMARLKVAP